MEPSVTASSSAEERRRAAPGVTDFYPSRRERSARFLERLDPVVHGRDAAEHGPLDPRQLEAFAERGFLFFERLFPAEEIRVVQSELERLRRLESLREEPRTVLEPGSGEVRSIFEVHRNHDLFSDLVREPRIAGIARQILGGEVYVHQSRINYKPGFRGKEFYWHSDFETWHVEDGMPRMRAISCSINLTDNDPCNGPVMVIPGSHLRYLTCVGETPAEHYKQSLRKQEYGVPDDASLTSLVEEGGIEAPTGSAGSVLFFDCNMMHGSSSNITPWPRSNVFFVYNSVENVLVAPFGGREPRPEFIASRDFTPLG